MIGKAEAIAHGAATIVNAMALGKGAAFGIDLWTKAEVKLTNEPQIIEGKIISDPSEDSNLIELTALQVLQHFNVEGEFGAQIKTWSNIPIARGLKSSSAAANAVALATVTALDKSIADLDMIRIGVEAAFKAKVTVTGAFDDACASFLGGAVITDNSKRRLIKRTQLPGELVVLLLVPQIKAYTGKSDMKKLQHVKPLVRVAYTEALRGRFWTALTLNGLIYSSALGFDSSLAIEAINAGALAAGLCGKGPAVAAVVSSEKVDNVKTVFQSYEGEVLQVGLNNEKARVVKK